MSLIPQNATDERILPTIKSESLDAVNGVYEQLGKISYKGLKEIEQKVSDGSLQSLGDLRTYQRESEDDHITKEYYCPLTCVLFRITATEIMMTILMKETANLPPVTVN